MWDLPAFSSVLIFFVLLQRQFGYALAQCKDMACAAVLFVCQKPKVSTVMSLACHFFFALSEFSLQ